MKEKQFNYFINVGYAKNDDFSEIHVRKGDKIIFENHNYFNKIRIYQYSTRIFVGLVTQEEFDNCIEH
jgi:hypothetical protein